MIPAEAIERVKDALRPSDVVGRRVNLRRVGMVWKGLCCFHEERTPSLVCDDPRGTFKCFGCGAGGDIVEFTMRAYGWSFNEAITELAKEAGVDLPTSPEEAKRDAKRLSLIEVLEEAQKWFRDQLYQSSEARAYLKARKVTNEQVERFGLGYAPNTRSGLKETLGKKLSGEGIARLSQAGLVVSGEGIAVSYDRFRGRVVFPIRDPRGRTVSFGGRILGPGEPKYLNGPETEVFHKGSALYNIDKARQSAHDGAPVLICEGYFDVIACTGAGFPATVGTMGTALSPDHLQTLWRLSDAPILLLDGDAAGQRAAAKVMRMAFPLLSPGRSLRVAQCPAGSDPDELVRVRGQDALKRAVDASEGLADAFWRVSTVGRNLNSPDALAKLEHELMATFSTIPDDQLRHKYRDDGKRRILALQAPRPIIRANGFSNHSTSPAAIRLIHGLPQGGGFTLKEAVVLANLVRARDADEKEIPGLSDRTRQVISEIHHLISDLPDDQFMAALEVGSTAEAMTEAYSILHSAGIVSYDIEGFPAAVTKS